MAPILALTWALVGPPMGATPLEPGPGATHPAPEPVRKRRAAVVAGGGVGFFVLPPQAVPVVGSDVFVGGPLPSDRIRGRVALGGQVRMAFGAPGRPDGVFDTIVGLRLAAAGWGAPRGRLFWQAGVGPRFVMPWPSAIDLTARVGFAPFAPAKRMQSLVIAGDATMAVGFDARHSDRLPPVIVGVFLGYARI